MDWSFEKLINFAQISIENTDEAKLIFLDYVKWKI